MSGWMVPRNTWKPLTFVDFAHTMTSIINVAESFSRANLVYVGILSLQQVNEEIEVFCLILTGPALLYFASIASFFLLQGLFRKRKVCGCVPLN